MEAEAKTKNEKHFGRYLERIREEKNITKQEIADYTRTSVDTISAIEQGNHKKLPSAVFVHGFITNYAKFIDADAEKALMLYKDSHRIYTEQNKNLTDLDHETQNNKSNTNLFAFLILLALIIIFSILFADVKENNIKTTNDIKASENKTSSENTDDMTEKNLKLIILCVEKTGIKIIVDGQEAQSYLLNKGDTLKFEAKFNYNILISNATGIKMNLNSKPVFINGKDNETVSITIP